MLGDHFPEERNLDFANYRIIDDFAIAPGGTQIDYRSIFDNHAIPKSQIAEGCVCPVRRPALLAEDEDAEGEVLLDVVVPPDDDVLLEQFWKGHEPESRDCVEYDEGVVYSA